MMMDSHSDDRDAKEDGVMPDDKDIESKAVPAPGSASGGGDTRRVGGDGGGDTR